MSALRWRLLSRDLGAAFAFSSLLFSYLLPSWVVLFFGLCLLLAIFGFRPLQKMEFVSGLLLLVFAVPLFASAILGRMDFVISACCFACIFSAIRMMGTPHESIDAQVNLGALLMMTGGAALTGELWYLLSLCGFAIFTPISMGITVMQHHGAKPHEMRPALYRVGTGISLALIGMILFFILLPRLSWKLAHIPLSQGLGAVSGLSDTVKLQSNGNIKTSPRIIARIELKPNPHRSQLDHYWVARYYRDFDGKEWHSPRIEKTSDAQIILPRKNGRKIFQSIELLPAYGSSTLIALDSPFVFSSLERQTTQGALQTFMTELRDSEVRATLHSTSLSYSAQSFLPGNEQELPSTNTAESTKTADAKPIAVLPLKTPLKIHRSSSASSSSKNFSSLENIEAVPDSEEEFNAWMEDYRRLPEETDHRIAKLAQDILKTEKSPLKAARLIENYLSQNLQYSLDETISAENPLADFLFVKKRGHCEQFATAFAVLLRQGGFASRVVGGFFGGEQLGNRYILRAGDAHAWTQVYDNRLGWVSFDATPPVGRQARPNAFFAWALEVQEAMDAWWQSKVVDYSIKDQTRIAKSLLNSKAQATEIRWKPFAPSWQWLWLSAFPFFLGGFLYFRARKLSPEAKFLMLLEQRLQKLALLTQETPSVEALLPLLQKQRHPLKVHIESAYSHYLRWRFGNIPYEPQTARKLLKSLQGASKNLRKQPS
jgi:transglutaminase-like putative cysteine protease